MTTAPKLEPEAMRAVALDRARRFLADWDSVSHVAGLAEPILIILSRVLVHAADEIERFRAAPSAGLREDNVLTPRADGHVTDNGRDAALDEAAKIADVEASRWMAKGPEFTVSERSQRAGTALVISWAIRALKAPSKDRGDSALLTLSKERGGVASPHQTIARDE
jgi:hypothetical protein